MNPLARRLRRCVVLAALAGVAAVGFGLLPGKELHARDTDALLEVVSGGGPLLVAYVAVVLGFGALVYRTPSRVVALAWTGFALVVGFVIAVMAFGFGDLWPRVVYLWPAHAMRFAFGVMLVMIFPITFVVGLIGDRGKRPDEPSARVVS